MAFFNFRNKKQSTPPPIIGRVTPIDTTDDQPFFSSDLNIDRVGAIVRNSEYGNSADMWRLARTVILQDAHIQAELFKRKNAVLGDQLTVTAWSDSPEDLEAAEAVEALLLNFRGLFAANAHLLDGTIYPLAILEKVYGPADPAKPELGRRVALQELVPVPARLIGWDANGLPVVNNKADMCGYRAVPPLDSGRYIVHRSHLVSAPDRYGGPLRAIVMLWLLSAMSTTWWARYLERYGAPFIVGKCDSAEDSDRRVLEGAISYATQLGGLVISSSSSVELHEATKDSGAGFQAFKAQCRNEISRLILGQTLSSITSATGMGDGTADLQGEVREDIRKFDARVLGDTLRSQLVDQWLEVNGYTGNAPTITFAGDASAEIARTATIVQTLASAGLEPTDDGVATVGERVGIPLQRRGGIAAQPPLSSLSAADSEDAASPFFRRRDFYAGGSFSRV